MIRGSKSSGEWEKRWLAVLGLQGNWGTSRGKPEDCCSSIMHPVYPSVVHPNASTHFTDSFENGFMWYRFQLKDQFGKSRIWNQKVFWNVRRRSFLHRKCCHLSIDVTPRLHCSLPRVVNGAASKESCPKKNQNIKHEPLAMARKLLATEVFWWRNICVVGCSVGWWATKTTSKESALFPF